MTPKPGDVIDGRRVLAVTEGHIEVRKKIGRVWVVELVHTHTNVSTEDANESSAYQPISGNRRASNK